MSSRYKELKVPPEPERSEEDMPLSAAKIEDNTFSAASRGAKTNVFYLLLSSSI